MQTPAAAAAAAAARTPAAGRAVVLAPSTPAAGQGALLGLAREGSEASALTDLPATEPSAVLFQSRTHQALDVGHLPADALQLIDALGLDEAGVHAIVDQASGYAAVAVPDRCFVWNFKRAAALGAPSVQFPLAPESDLSSHALLAFVPHASGSPPGLVAATADGNVRYWSDVSLSPSSFHNLQINLADDDSVCFMVACEPVGYLLSTASSAVFRISLFDPNGMAKLSAVPLQRASGLITRVTSLFGYGQRDADYSPVVSGKIVCLIPGRIVEARTSREMYVLSGQSMQKWLLSKSQGDKLVSEIDVRRALVTNLLSSLDSQASDLTLRIEDADYTRDDQIAFLVGFSELNRIYNYSVIVGRESNGILAIDPLSGCDLKLSQQANHVSALSLSLSNGGPFFFVNSDNQVVISTLQSGVDFEETLPFTHAQSGIIGLSVDKPRPASQDADTAISAVVAFLGSSQNLVQVNVSAAAVSDDVDMTRLISTGQVTEQSKERATQMLRTKLEQAVFFGSSNGAERSNPIAFDLAQPGGDIDAAAVQVSESILTSTSQHIQPFLDQGAHLTERFHRIDRVVSFISTHGLLSKLSHAARLKLSFNAEKIVAAQALWRFLNAVRGQPEAVKRNKALLLLEDSIGRFMTGQLSQEDPVKDFFENKVESMDAFLSFAADRVQAVASSTTSAEVHYEVYELNRLCLIALTAATDYRIDNAARYELGGSVDVEPWTASERLLMALNALFDATLKLIHGSNAGIYPSLDDDMDSLDLFDLDMPPPAELRHRMGWQLCRLSDVLLSAFRDRTSFLVSCGPDEERNLQTLRQHYSTTQPKLIHPLVDLGRSEQAFALSEKYREFHTLVELCLGDENRRSRIISYLDRFGSDFSDVLFDAYLKKGMLRELAEQPSKYHHLLERFYAQNSVPSLSWIHDVSVGRFEKASSSLWDVARDTRQRDSQMLALSLSMLAAAEAAENVELFEESAGFYAFTRARDALAAQASIAQLFESFADQPANRNVMQVPEPVDSEKQLKAILAKQYTRFSKTHPMLMTLVAKAIRNLLRGVKLDLRDTIELLTSLDFTPQVAASELFFLALDIVGDQLFNESEAELSELELFYVNLIWRRAWIQGGWNEIMAKLKRSSTEQAQDALRLTPLFELVRNLVPLIGTKPYARHYQLSPQQLTVLPSMALLRLLHADLDEAQLTQMHQEYAAEQEALEEMFRVPTIVQMFDECVRMCQRDMDVE